MTSNELAAGFWAEAVAMHCAGCTETYVHPVRVEVDRGGDVVDVDNDGVGFASREQTERGVIILLEFACESGHRFAYRFVFHKGSTFVSVLRQSDAPVDWESGPTFRTIWRD